MNGTVCDTASIAITTRVFGATPLSRRDDSTCESHTLRQRLILIWPINFEKYQKRKKKLRCTHIQNSYTSDWIKLDYVLHRVFTIKPTHFKNSTNHFSTNSTFFLILHFPSYKCTFVALFVKQCGLINVMNMSNELEMQSKHFNWIETNAELYRVFVRIHTAYDAFSVTKWA